MDRLTNKKGKQSKAAEKSLSDFTLIIRSSHCNSSDIPTNQYVNYLAKNAAVFVTLKTERQFTQYSKGVGIFYTQYYIQNLFTHMYVKTVSICQRYLSALQRKSKHGFRVFLLRSVFHDNVKIRKLVLHMVEKFLNKNGGNENKNILKIIFCGGSCLFILDL